MKKNIFHALVIVFIGIIIGDLLGYLFRPVIIGIIFGVALSLRIGGISQWRTGALYGAAIGLVIGITVGPMAVIIGDMTLPSFIGLGLSGIIGGALVGGITCKIFKTEKSWFW